MATNDVGEFLDRTCDQVQICALVLSAVLCFLACAVYSPRCFCSHDTQNVIVLDSKINPNLACTASLERLAGVGLVRSEAIVAYRKQYAAQSDVGAFSNCADLQKVKGIGPRTVENICKWLEFK